MLVFASIVSTIIIFFLAGIVASRVEEKIEKDPLSFQKNISLSPSKYAIVISFCIVFIAVYLLFLVGPFLGRIARNRVYREEADWFTFMGMISLFIVSILCIFGIYAIMRILAENLYLIGRRLFYWTIGIFIIAFWVFVIYGITF